MANQVWQAMYLDRLRITSVDLVVDIGCGDGQVCALAGQSGAEVIGIDIGAKFIEEAVQRMRLTPARGFRGIVSNCDPVPLPDGIASVVLCTEVLEHVDIPERLLADLVRIGKPGARYLLSVPDPVSEAIMRVAAPRWYFEANHQRVYGREEFHTLVTAAGLEAKEHLYFGFPEAMAWFVRMLYGMENADALPPPPPSLLSDWDQFVSRLAAMPRGLDVLHALSQYVPKSHVLIAEKIERLAIQEPEDQRWSVLRAALRRLLRVRIGSFEIGVRRVAA
jgi:SAM-dependent methyltransferase